MCSIKISILPSCSRSWKILQNYLTWCTIPRCWCICELLDAWCICIDECAATCATTFQQWLLYRKSHERPLFASMQALTYFHVRNNFGSDRTCEESSAEATGSPGGATFLNTNNAPWRRDMYARASKTASKICVYFITKGCVCLDLYVCVHAYVHAHTHTHTHTTCICACTHTHTQRRYIHMSTTFCFQLLSCNREAWISSRHPFLAGKEIIFPSRKRPFGFLCIHTSPVLAYTSCTWPDTIHVSLALPKIHQTKKTPKICEKGLFELVNRLKTTVSPHILAMQSRRNSWCHS